MERREYSRPSSDHEGGTNSCKVTIMDLIKELWRLLRMTVINKRLGLSSHQRADIVISDWVFGNDLTMPEECIQSAQPSRPCKECSQPEFTFI